MNTKNQNYFIDNIKCVLIFLVVFGHLIERYIESDSTLMGIYLFIYFFHMPLFIFISGYLSKNIKKSNEVYLKTLLLPYIVLNIIWYSLVYLYTKDFRLPLIYPGWTLWFLLSLFFWRISLKYLVKIKYILPISFILGLLIGILPNGSILSISRTIVFLPFFLLGYYTEENLLNKVKDKLSIWLCLFGIALFIGGALYIAENNYIDYKLLYGSYSYSDMNLNLISGCLYRTICYIGSIVLSLLVCSIIPSNKIFYTEIGKSTMYVYSLHIYIIIIIFYFIPSWGESVIKNWIVIISPLFITYILSKKLFANSYDWMFNKIYKLISKLHIN